MIEHEKDKTSEYYRSIPTEDRWLFTCMKFNQLEELLEKLKIVVLNFLQIFILIVLVKQTPLLVVNIKVV